MNIFLNSRFFFFCFFFFVFFLPNVDSVSGRHIHGRTDHAPCFHSRFPKPLFYSYRRQSRAQNYGLITFFVFFFSQSVFFFAIPLAFSLFVYILSEYFGRFIARLPGFVFALIPLFKISFGRSMNRYPHDARPPT